MVVCRRQLSSLPCAVAPAAASTPSFAHNGAASVHAHLPPFPPRTEPHRPPPSSPPHVVPPKRDGRAGALPSLRGGAPPPPFPLAAAPPSAVAATARLSPVSAQSYRRRRAATWMMWQGGAAGTRMPTQSTRGLARHGSFSNCT
ncbi:hypothetical protein PVAP13_7NG236400 [Panicum virgatum]|uniref:Uncharacterized protein n=1 Tax=Panicum virgatum TaxID=38727 RepID=A0A8T0Q0N3_PANVG|nr:hypothetical protein PVAP13_7NG236400 [Panicum virgatum]